MSLLASLEAALSAHPPPLTSAGTLRIHTLLSTPRPVKSLYPLAHIHPTDLESCHDPISAHLEHIVVTASWTPSESTDCILIYALETYLYTLPQYGSAVLYISKLDSTGYGPRSLSKYGSSLTSTLTSAFVKHFSTFKHWKEGSVGHLSLHILARSQPAYLFPGSPENKGKKVLSDGGLVKWWRQAMTTTLDENARAFYLVPGYNKLESNVLLPLPTDGKWTYGWPYSAVGAGCDESNLPPLPLHWRKKEAPAEYDQRSVRTIPTLMPHFNDDPKTRFMDELQRDAHEHAGWKKKDDHDDEADEPDRKKVKLTATTSSSSNGVPLTVLMSLQRERQSLDDLSIDEFWERMGFRQECCAGNAVGVIACLFTSPDRESELDMTPPAAKKLALPHPTIGDMLFKQLMRDVCEWDKKENAIKLTHAWDEAVNRAVKRKGGWVLDAKDGEEEVMVGKGVIWADVAIKGLSEEQIKQATEAAPTAPVATANVLSVKRKKKPAPQA